MRYITARQPHQCAVCKEKIGVGEVAIQSQARYYLVYHEDCHYERFGCSLTNAPTNDRPN